MHAEQLVGHHLPALGADDDDAVVDQHTHQFLEEVRVAFGAAGEQVAQRGRHGLEPAQQRVGQFAAASLAERREVDALVVALAAAPQRATLEQRRARQAQRHHRQVAAGLREVVDEVERAFVGPVQVVEQEHERRAALLLQATKVLGQRVEGAVADLLGLVCDAGDVRVGVVVEPDQLADQRRLLRGPRAQHRAEAARELGLRDGLRIAVEDLEAPGQQVAQQAVGHVVAVGLRPTLEVLHRLAPQLEPVREFEAKPALAQARIADHRDERERALVAHGLEGLGQAGEFGVAPDHPRVDALQATVRDPERPRLGAQDQVAAHRLGDALDRDRRLLLDIEHAAHMAVGVVADAKRAGWCGLLHARRHVDRDAADAALGIDATTQQHRTGVDADSHVEARQAMLGLEARGQQRRLLDDREPRPHRALGVVLERLVGAEHGEQAVTGVLQHPALALLDDGGQAFEGTVHHGVHVFRVELLAQVGGADHIHEQHGDGLQPLLAAARPRLCCRELVAQRGQRHVGDRVAEHGPLRFERGNRRFDLFGGVVHAFEVAAERRAAARRHGDPVHPLGRGVRAAADEYKATRLSRLPLQLSPSALRAVSGASI